MNARALICRARRHHLDIVHITTAGGTVAVCRTCLRTDRTTPKEDTMSDQTDPYEGLHPADGILAPTAVIATGASVNAASLIGTDDVEPVLIIEFSGIPYDYPEANGRTVGCQAVIPAKAVDPFIRLVTLHRNVLASQHGGPEFDAPSVTLTALEYLERVDAVIHGTNDAWTASEVHGLIRELTEILAATPEGNLG